jgi:hypothetical protein
MGKNLYYTIPQFFEDRMLEHSMVDSFRRLLNDNEIIYEIRRKRYGDTVRVWLSDHYHHTEMDFYNRPKEIIAGDYILIARPEAADHGECSIDKIRIGKIGDLMGALTRRHMWTYEPPSAEEKQKRRIVGKRSPD